MRDFWAFRTMVTPVMIQIIFWVGALICFVIGGGMIFMGISGYDAGMASYFWKGLLLFIFEPLGVRLYCELLIVLFRINETLTEIKNIIERPSPQPTNWPEAA
jgi:Domain of unknown function (DUF4282)